MIKMFFICCFLFSFSLFSQDNVETSASVITEEIQTSKVYDSLNAKINNLEKIVYGFEKQFSTETFNKIKELNVLQDSAAILLRKSKVLNYQSVVSSTSIDKDKALKLKEKAELMLIQADTLKENLKQFTVVTLISSLNETKLEKSKYEISKKVIKSVGVFQILTGTLGLLCTIIDANIERKINYNEPIYDSKGNKIGSKKASTTYKPEWLISHTTTTLISSGLIITGIITVNF